MGLSTFAIISDIHSNLAALNAVFEVIDTRGIEDIVCLGDIVGYGPDPQCCLDMVMQRCQIAVCGNHDQAVFYEPFNFNIGAERASFWTRMSFEAEPDHELRDQRWDFLGGLKTRHVVDDMLFVHGSPRRPINEYLFADDVYTSPGKIMMNFEKLEQTTCFVGHTHVPGVFLDDPYFDPPDELPEPGRYELGGEKAIVNVGSVGQPRDRDPRACFVIIEDNEVEYIRVEYDRQDTIQKIHAVPDLDNFLAERLQDGR